MHVCVVDTPSRPSHQFYVGHDMAVQLLFDRGADINAQNGWCGNVLQAALVGAHEQAVLMLHEKAKLRHRLVKT